MRMTKLALASGLVLATMIGVSTSAFAWSDDKSEKREEASVKAIMAQDAADLARAGIAAICLGPRRRTFSSVLRAGSSLVSRPVAPLAWPGACADRATRVRLP